MLEKEMKELDISISQVNSGLESIYKVIDSILAHPAKNYDLTFKNQSFKLSPPFTKKEEKGLRKIRKKYISLILNYVLKKRIKKLVGDSDNFPKDIFEIWYAFAYGQDPKDHQLEKINLKAIYAVGDEEHGKARPLDEESYQVHLQDVTKVKEEDFLKESL